MFESDLKLVKNLQDKIDGNEYDREEVKKAVSKLINAGFEEQEKFRVECEYEKTMSLYKEYDNKYAGLNKSIKVIIGLEKFGGAEKNKLRHMSIGDNSLKR